MICVLAEPDDDDALWLTAGLRHLGREVEFVLPEELLVGARLTCRVETGAVSVGLTLRDGRSLGDGDLALVVNRLGELPTVTATAPVDAAYLREEWRAALAVWLRSLSCPVLNPPRAASLAGPVLAPAAWRATAAAQGLRCAPWRSDDRSDSRGDPLELVCLAGLCFGGDEGTRRLLAGPLAALAAQVGAPLLGATFAPDGEGWTFLQATVRPRLRRAGLPLVDALVRCASTRAG